MREIVLDTETTGRDPLTGDRIVEIGCIELVNHIPTDTPAGTFHCYVNPERPMPPEAERVHGLSDAFLATHPVFAEVADRFLDFIADAPLIIHNAEFDLGFLNAELRRLGRPALPPSRAVCTLTMARKKFPGAAASLDALCRRYGVDLSARTMHGALLDAQLLAEVYLELKGGRQPGLILATQDTGTRPDLAAGPKIARPPRPHAPSDEELAAHQALLDKLTQPIWRL